MTAANFRKAMVAASTAVLAGCASIPVNAPAENVSIIASATADRVEPVAMDMYRVGAGDQLKVTVFREPDLGGESLLVDPAGKISLPSIGQMHVLGRTTDELAREIANLLNEKLLRDASVSVSLAAVGSRVVTVDGEVKRPGIYPMQGRLSLMQAIALAQGVAEFSDRSKLIVFREVNGKMYAARFNLNAIRAAQAPDPELLPGDKVVMGASRAQAIYRDILQVLPGLAGIFIAIQQN